MSTIKTEAEERRDRLYSHPSSVARRAEAVARPDKTPQAQMLCRQYDARVALGQQHREEMQKLVARQDFEIAQESAGAFHPSVDTQERHKRERAELIQNQGHEFAELERRQRDERAQARAATR